MLAEDQRIIEEAGLCENASRPFEIKIGRFGRFWHVQDIGLQKYKENSEKSKRLILWKVKEKGTSHKSLLKSFYCYFRGNIRKKL